MEGERENMREISEGPPKPGYRSLLFCLFEGAVEGLSQQVCMGVVGCVCAAVEGWSVRKVGGGGRDKATCALIGDGAAEQKDLWLKSVCQGQALSVEGWADSKEAQ